MNESDAPESSSAKRVGFHKTMGMNSTDIGAEWSGTTSSTKEEDFSHASVKRGGTVVSDWAEFFSDNVTADVRG